MSPKEESSQQNQDAEPDIVSVLPTSVSPATINENNRKYWEQPGVQRSEWPEKK